MSNGFRTRREKYKDGIASDRRKVCLPVVAEWQEELDSLHDRHRQGLLSYAENRRRDLLTKKLFREGRLTGHTTRDRQEAATPPRVSLPELTPVDYTMWTDEELQKMQLRIMGLSVAKAETWAVWDAISAEQKRRKQNED